MPDCRDALKIWVSGSASSAAKLETNLGGMSSGWQALPVEIFGAQSRLHVPEAQVGHHELAGSSLGMKCRVPGVICKCPKSTS